MKKKERKENRGNSRRTLFIFDSITANYLHIYHETHSTMLADVYKIPNASSYTRHTILAHIQNTGTNLYMIFSPHQF